MPRKVIGGIFVVGAVLLGLLTVVNFFFKLGSWHHGYALLSLAVCAADGIGAVACVMVARRYLSPVAVERDPSSVG